MTPQEVTEQLEGIASDQDFASASSELTDGWTLAGAGLETVVPILHFIEEHPTIDFGTPGALVHFVERFYQHGYEELLLESVSRKPTSLTLWMVNRIANGTKEPDLRQRLVAAMQAARDSPAADPNTKQMADRFLSRLAT